MRVLRFKEEHSGAWADHVPATSARDAGDATAPAGPEPGLLHIPRSEREHSGARAVAVHPTLAGDATAPDNEPLAPLVQKLGGSAPADCNRPLLAAVNKNHGAPRQPAPDVRRAAQGRALLWAITVHALLVSQTTLWAAGPDAATAMLGAQYAWPGTQPLVFCD